ncbi:MAG: dihydrofolate reductase [Clostridia bacterium]|nr:dihydrofolate reductase [Clostridia bacterium]
MISMIAAVGKNGELGKNNGLLWRLDGDLPFFKRVTMGKSVIMGRKTFESLPKALPGRKNIVITSNESFEAEGVKRASSPEEALKMCEGEEEVFIIGGGRIYSEFIGTAQRLYLTEAEAEDETADTYFPVFDHEKWVSTVIDEGGTQIKYRHVLYERKKHEA